jgi:hypothetical protein
MYIYLFLQVFCGGQTRENYRGRFAGLDGRLSTHENPAPLSERRLRPLIDGDIEREPGWEGCGE